MRLLIQGRDPGHKLNRSVLEFARERFETLDRYVPEPATVELRLDHLERHRKGKTHYVHGLVVIPGEHTTFHAEVIEEDFRTGLDRLYEKLERHLRRWHRRRVRSARQPVARNLIARLFRRA